MTVDRSMNGVHGEIGLLHCNGVPHANKLETFEDALWKLQNFNTQNWKPCTLDLSPCGKRNAVKSRLGHLWIVFYKWYPPLFALSHPFKPLVDYRLLCSQYNTGRTSYSGTSLENGRGWIAVKRQPFAGFVNNQNTLLCKCSWSNDFVSKVSDRSGRRHFKYILNVGHFK